MNDRGDLLGRLMERTVFDEDAKGCWLWQGARNKRGGHGVIWHDGRLHYVHGAAYGLLVGPVPDGLELDHLCRTPHCWNPDHLEPVTHAENVARGRAGAPQLARTHCPQGHPYDEENTRVYDGRRNCRACRLEAGRRRYAQRKAKGYPPVTPTSERCRRGHPMDASNAYWHNGVRYCRACRTLAKRRYRERQRNGSQPAPTATA